MHEPWETMHLFCIRVQNDVDLFIKSTQIHIKHANLTRNSCMYMQSSNLCYVNFNVSKVFVFKVRFSSLFPKREMCFQTRFLNRFPLRLLRTSTVFLGLRLTCNNSAARLVTTTNTITLYIILLHVHTHTLTHNIFTYSSVEIFLPCSTRPSHRRRAPHVPLPSHTWPWEENVIDFFSPFFPNQKTYQIDYAQQKSTLSLL